ncbi:MATE family efflux transporter [Jannaschia ovalis]|uniref:Multidrug-efflux transporter n=1 Tax=Jannaschia ovalis TaxID=3038773 RepID=A0ABY8LCG1_9RHOB|nr:MATE family efflux transporter [Jannaschia sp. GRR-S6-38]WGH78994.1 MATE family efflux transporter [Jannaschia sp. GRR-S6-38]
MADTLTHHMRRTLVLGLPLVGGQLAQMAIGVTDTLMLGWYSVPALAAGTIGATFFFSVFILGAGFAYAVLPMASAAAGRGDEIRVRRIARMGLWLSAGFAALALPLFWWSGPLLSALGQDPQVAEGAQTYLRIAGPGLIPALLTATLRSHLSALEHTRIVLWAVLAAGVLNAGVNWLLIFGNWGFPELGLAGAAIASLGVHALTTGLLIFYATRGPGMARFDLLRNIHRPDWPVFGEIFRLGWPIGLTLLSESGLFAASALMMGVLGTVPLAAHGVALQVAALVFMVHLGLSSAVTVRVGQFWGREDREGMLRAALAAAILSFGAVLLATWLYIGGGEAIIALFVDPTDPARPAILDLGARLLVLAALFQLVDAAQVMALGMLRGVQDTRRPMVYAFVAYWMLGLPASWILGIEMGFGPEGIWLGLCVGLAAAAITLSLRFLRLILPPPRAPIRG